MKCSSCGFENREDAKFCKDCGVELVLKCPACGYPHEPNSKFCDECGHDFKPAVEAHAVDYTQPQSYTPRFLADKILTTRSSIEGERKLVTVFFADVAGYTPLTEKLDPEEVHGIMDGAFKILMDEIHRFEGTINQFTGDGVMALFGAPLAHEDHAQRACHASLSVQNALIDYGEKIQAETGLEFKMRIGLNSGHVIVGSIGDDLRMDYTAVGDTTNLADRMQGLATPGSVMVSAHTHRLASNYFEFNSLGKFELKGKKEPQEVWELIKSGEVTTRIGASVSKGLTRFVGRQNSMSTLNEAFEKADAGSGQLIGIVGEAGVGKSRLLLEFVNQLSPGEYTCMEGRCLHYGTSMPYLPVLDILRSYFDITEGDREFIIKQKVVDKLLALDEKLEKDISPIFELLSIKAEDEAYIQLEPQQKKDKTFEALRDILIRQSREKPVVLIIEDLHWIDNTTQEFINYLIDWLTGSRILLLLLYRPEYSHQWGSKSFYTKIGLDQLGPESSLELIKAILQESDAAEDLKELILSKAAGNPLFMEEFTRNLVENGTIEKQGQVYTARKNIEAIQVPDTIQGIIAARMDRLEDDLKRTLQVASVIGRDFAFRILQSITGMKEELKSYLLNLQGLEFIFEKSLFPELEYIFKHALTRDVAYNSLLQKRRREIHERIGEAIEVVYADKLEEFYEMLAYHFSQGDNLEQSYKYLKLSGEKAKETYSYQEAYQFYKDTIDTLKKLPDSTENKKRHIDVVESMHMVTIALNSPEDYLDILLEGEKIANELDDAKSLSLLNSILSMYYTFKGKMRLAVESAEKGFSNAMKTGDVDLVSTRLASLFNLYMAKGDYQQVVDISPDVIELFEKSGREREISYQGMNIYSYTVSSYGRCLGYVGYIDKGIEMLAKGLQIALEPEADDRFNLILIERMYGMLLNDLGRAEESLNHLKNSIRYSEEINSPFQQILTLGFMVWTYAMMGEYDTALECGVKAMELDKESGVTIFGSDIYIHLSMFYIEIGDLENARLYANKTIDISSEQEKIFRKGCSLMLLGTITGKEDVSQIDKAEETIRQGMKILDDLKVRPIHAQGFFYLGELYADSGQKQKALETLKTAEKNFQEMGMDYWLKKTKGILDRL